MTRSEFDGVFGPLTKQLGVKVNRFQADLYFKEFHGKDYRDFKHACYELGFGKQGWMPQIPNFRDYVAAAVEIRQEEEKKKRTHEADKTWAGHGLPQDDPMEFLWATACLLNIRDRALGLDPIQAKRSKEKIQAILDNPLFAGKFFGWSPKDTRYLRPQDWLKAQLEIPAKCEREAQ